MQSSFYFCWQYQLLRLFGMTDLTGILYLKMATIFFFYLERILRFVILTKNKQFLFCEHVTYSIVNCVQPVVQGLNYCIWSNILGTSYYVAQVEPQKRFQNSVKCRSSPPQVFSGKGVLKICSKFKAMPKCDFLGMMAL